MKKSVVHKLLQVILMVSLAVSFLQLANGSPSESQVGKHKANPSGYHPRLASTSSKEGKELFSKHHCVSCHMSGGTGGCLGPPLDGIGARRDSKFILSRITNSSAAIAEFHRKYREQELMPHPRINAPQASLITEYLLTLAEPVKGFTYEGHKIEKPNGPESAEGRIDGASVAAGRKLYSDSGCAACHSIGGLGGSFAPALDNVSQRNSAAAIRKVISKANFLDENGEEYSGRGAPMPPSNLSKEDVDHITDFLMSLKPRTPSKTKE